MQQQSHEVQSAVQIINTGSVITEQPPFKKKMRDYGFLKTTEPQPGKYVARLYRYVDLGHQPDGFLGYAKCIHRIMLTWELFGAGCRKSERIHTATAFFNVSMEPKAHLRRFIEAWLDCQLDDRKVSSLSAVEFVGHYGVLDVTVKDNLFVVKGITPCKDDAQLPKPVNKEVIFDLLASDDAVFCGLTSKIQQQIMRSREWVEVTGAPGLTGLSGHVIEIPNAN